MRAFLVLVVVALVAVVAGGLVAHDRGWGPFAADDDAQAVNPFHEHAQYAAPADVLVAAQQQARADGDDHASAVLSRVASVPAGIWLLPEQYPSPEAVGAHVRATMSSAGSKVPLFVVYGLPHRDCAAGQSSGGLDDATYLPWVEAIAGAAGAGGRSAVVLEPDALATADACDLHAERVRLVSGAVAELRKAGITTYVDAGHSSWVSADTMAGLLRDVGVSTVRGFATNVSNYQPLDAETAYAEQIRAQVGGHFVVDTGRDGVTGQGTKDWCNPPGQAFGEQPGYVADRSGLDALLWVKPPAESDGTCHGGPPAGEVWVQRAVEMADAAGW